MPLSRASLLRSEPAGTLRSLDEMFALAHAMESRKRRAATPSSPTKCAGKARISSLSCSRSSPLPSASMSTASRDGRGLAVPRIRTRRWCAGKRLRRSTSRHRGEVFAPDDAVPRARDGGPQRGAGLRVLVLSRGLFGGSGNQASLRVDGEGRAGARGDPAEGEAARLSSRARPERRESARTDGIAGRCAKAGAPPRGAVDGSRASPVGAGRGPHARAIDKTMRMADEAGDFGSFPAARERRDAQTIAEALADAYLEGTRSARTTRRASRSCKDSRRGRSRDWPGSVRSPSIEAADRRARIQRRRSRWITSAIVRSCGLTSSRFWSSSSTYS